MSFIKCVMDKINTGAITSVSGDEILSVFERNADNMMKAKGALTKDLKSGTEKLNWMIENLTDDEFARIEETSVLELQRSKNLSKRNKILQIDSIIEIKNKAETFNSSKHLRPLDEKDRKLQSYLAIYSEDPSRGAPYSSIEIDGRMIKGEFVSKLTEFILMHNDNLLSMRRNKSELKNIVTEAFGGNSGSEYASRTYKAISGVFEEARLMFNKYGGDIKKRDDFGLPTRYEAVLVAEKSKEEFVTDVIDRLDLERTFNQASGLPFSKMTRAEQEDYVGGAYDAIVDDREIIENSGASAGFSIPFGGGKISNRGSDSRTFQYKDGDSWMYIHNKYGQGDVYDVVIGHINSMSRDISIMRQLGPDPEVTKRFILQDISDMYTSGAKGKTNAGFYLDKKNRARARIEQAHNFALGKDYQIVNESLHNSVKVIKNIFYASRLGSATLSAAPGDLALSSARISHIGGSLRNMMKYYGVGLLKGRRGAIELMNTGHLAQGIIEGVRGAYRMEDGSATAGLSDRISGTVLRLTGLELTTEAMRSANKYTYAGMIARDSELPFENLNMNLKKEFDLMGIGPREWDIIRSSPKITSSTHGGLFQFHNTIPDSDIAAKYYRWMERMTDQGVLVPNDRQASLFHVGGTKGTLIGVILESVKMLKSFPLAMYYNNLKRLIDTNPNAGALLSETITFGSWALLGGIFATTVYNLDKGEDITNSNMYTSERFWLDSLARSGLTPFIDATYRSNVSTNDALVDLMTAAAGPIISEPFRIAAFTKNEIQDFGGDWDSRATARRFFMQGKQYIPGQNHWVFGLALKRMIFENVAIAIDPDYRRVLERRNLSDSKEGKESWWKSGSTLPEMLK